MTKGARPFLAAILVALPAAALAQPGTETPPAASATAAKDFLGNLWARLRAVMPRPAPVVQSTTVTAGLRGAEATESELKPYWRGDREQDPAFRAESQALEAAQGLAEKGNYAGALQAFEAFLQKYPQSTLAPNAMFGAALAHAALGERARAAAGFEEFLKREPQHPLARDAEQALAALR